MLIIDECKDLIMGLQWLKHENLKKHIDFDNQQIKSLMIVSINETLNSVFQILNESILKGEFFETVKFKPSITDFENTISIARTETALFFLYEMAEIEDSDSDPIEIDNLFIKRDLILSILEDYLFAPLVKCFDKLDSILSFIECKTNKTVGKVIFNLEEDAVKFDNNYNTDIEKLYKIFVTNIIVAKIDLDLSINEDQLRRLIAARKVLTDNSVEGFDRIILNKCDYLLWKVISRMKKNKSVNPWVSYDIRHQEIDLKDLDPGVFKPLQKISNKHYSISPELYSEDEIYEIKKKYTDNKPLINKEYHTFVKIIKDKWGDLELMKKLIQKYKYQMDTDLSNVKYSNFERESKYSLKNYLMNNKFSLYLKNCKTFDIKEIDSELEMISSVQFETDIKNYFPYLRYCEFVGKELEERFSKNDKNQLSENKIIVEKLKKVISEAQEKLSWCKSEKYNGIQMSLEDIFVEDENGNNWFLYSSFVLPIDFENESEKIYAEKRRIDKFTTLIDIRESISEESADLQRLKNQLENSDKRSIEIIGIFSAIVMFTASNIQIFSIKDIKFNDALSFMLVFAYCMILFILLLWLVTRNTWKEVGNFHKLVLLIIGIIAFISMIFIYNN